MDEFVIVTWHDDIQFFMEQDGFKENAYLINDKKGLDDFGSSAYFVRKSWYLENEPKPWTIQDAKDGDVLATDNGDICLFDGTVEEGKYPFAYCGLTRYGFEFYDRTLPFTHDYVYPATQKQRDLLFQKMKEVGYEWDINKKELIKLERMKIDLSTEEKAKRYDEAIRKAKVIIKNYSEDKASITVLEHIFPELKKGEDERIKREILELVSIAGNGNQFEEIKDWLEKPVETKTIIIPKFRVGDEIKTANEESITITKIDEKGYWSEDLFICSFDEECIWDLVNDSYQSNNIEMTKERWATKN